MKGDPKVIDQLNKLLANELTAIDQYFIHSRMFADWGYGKLHEHISHEAAHETEHASRLIERMLLLEATPNMTQRDPLKVGSQVEEMLRNDLDLEYKVVDDLKAAIEVCEQQHDYQSRRILEQLLADTEEDHAYWLEQQLGLIKSLGIQNYLQSQQ
ncbi:bacterioferritin [Motiliproteus sp. SC1-56]|uniref:bacterioferritin n=1 Tax=Motiliproteus sp. SC1-56 TaxID=2799565 RepID=UPI001A90C011|nr:bacterioferritin [Motiliproteus sp. SC1-56]